MHVVEDDLKTILSDYGYRTTDNATEERLAHYLRLIADASRRMRLVGSADFETLARRHLGESLFLGTILPLGSQSLVDIGSGAGFPGLALALAWPELKTTLVESTGKKAAFLEQAARTLGLDITVQSRFLARRPAPSDPPAPPADILAVRALEKMPECPRWLPNWYQAPTIAAFWITEPLYKVWQQTYPNWQWSTFHRLPGSRERGIVVGNVPRGTF
jgi:16S rRNA (guanine527-N7)-methyltransferase